MFVWYRFVGAKLPAFFHPNWGFACNSVKGIVGFHMTSLKFKLKKLSILPTFYFHDALEQLKTNFHTNFRFKRVLGFVIEYA